MDLKADAKDNRIQTQISWANNKERLFKADLSASTLFIEEEQEKGPAKLRTEISLNKSPLILNDSTWHIAPSTITIQTARLGYKTFPSPMAPNISTWKEQFQKIRPIHCYWI